MAEAERNQARRTAILRMDPDLDVDSIQTSGTLTSSFSQAGPRPGIPEPQGDYDMVLQSGGAQSASKELRIRCQRSGMPDGDAGFVWRYNGDTDWRGCDYPNWVTAWEALTYTTTANAQQDPHIVSLPNGKAIVCYQHGALQVRTQTYAAGSWGAAVTAFTAASTPTHPLHPCMVVLPDDSVLLYHWIEDATEDTAQVRCWRSTDDGATWTLMQPWCLKTAVTLPAGAAGAGVAGYDLRRLRAAYLNGQVLLTMHLLARNTTPTYRDIIQQHASDDVGSWFDLVETWDGSTWRGAQQDVIAAHGRFYVAYIQTTNANSPVVVQELGDAFKPLTDAAVSTVYSTGSYATLDGTNKYVNNIGDCALAVSDQGVLFLMATRVVAGPVYHVLVQRSYDKGSTWADLGLTSLYGGDIYGTWGTTRLKDYSAAWLTGRLLVAHQWEAQTSNYDDSIAIAYLGGYTTVTRPGYIDYPLVDYYTGFKDVWLPFEEPGNDGWTANGAGTDALQAPGELRIVTTTPAAGTRYYDTPAGGLIGSISEGCSVFGDVDPVAGGSLTADNIAVRVRVSNLATADYDVSLRFDNTAVRLYDNNAGATVDTVNIAGRVQFMMSVAQVGAAGYAAVWVRSASTGSDREWTEGPSSTGLTAGAGAARIVQWGHLASADATSDWVQFASTDDSWNGTGLHAVPTNPDDLIPARFSAELVAVDDGVKIRAFDGPGRLTDTWHIDTRYDYEIARLHPAFARSPRLTWRSTATTQQTIAFALDSDALATTESEFGRDTVGIGLIGCNWRTGSFQRWDVGSAAWTTLTTIDLADGHETMNYTRRGRTLIPTASPTDQPFFHTGELTGWIAQLDATTFRKVGWNTEGKWEGNYAGPHLHIQLDDIDDGADPTTGTLRLWAPKAVILVNLLGETGCGYRLVIDNQSNADGYHEIGNLVVGPVHFFGADPSWTRVLTRGVGFTRREASDGTSVSRIVRPEPLTIELQWTEGVDTSNVYAADPDYALNSETGSAEGVATYAGTPWELDGLHRELRGAPCFLIPRVTKDTGTGGDALTLTREHECYYGFLDGEVRLEVIQGEELQSTSGEVIRIASIVFREEV